MPDKPLPAATLDALQEQFRGGHRNPVQMQLGQGGFLGPRPEHPELPPHPSGFQPDVPVVGSPEVARLVRMLLDLDPVVKQNVASVTMGPTRGSMEEMMDSGLSPERFKGTTLNGVQGRDDHHIGINPGRHGADLLSTLAHELAHAAGQGEPGAQATKQLLDNPREIPTPTDALYQQMQMQKRSGR